jgi:hypothetical protein
MKQAVRRAHHVARDEQGVEQAIAGAEVLPQRLAQLLGRGAARPGRDRFQHREDAAPGMKLVGASVLRWASRGHHPTPSPLAHKPC